MTMHPMPKRTEALPEYVVWIDEGAPGSGNGWRPYECNTGTEILNIIAERASGPGMFRITKNVRYEFVVNPPAYTVRNANETTTERNPK